MLMMSINNTDNDSLDEGDGDSICNVFENSPFAACCTKAFASAISTNL